MIYSESPRRKQINKQVIWGHWFALANIILAISISSVYVIASPAPSSFLSSIYLFITWFGHIGFVTFFGFILLVLPLCYKLTNQGLLRTIASIIAALGLAILAFDALLFNKTGFHISLSSAELVRNETQGQISAFSWLQWFYLVLLFVIWLMFQLVIANAIFQRIKKFQSIKIGKYVTSGFVVCFVTSHAIHVWADAKLYSPVLQQDNMFPLSYPATAKTLMSRAGILDLQDYRQRQDLQFNDASNLVVYPPEQVFCSIDNTKKAVFISLDTFDEALASSFNQAGLEDIGYHFVNQYIGDDYLASVLYGMPHVFLDSIKDKTPIATALPEAFDLGVYLHSQKPVSQDYSFAPSLQPTNEFLKNLDVHNKGLFIASLGTEDFKGTKLMMLASTSDIIISMPRAKGEAPHLYSNIESKVEMTSTEDIAPTLVNALGCFASADKFAMGQAIQSPLRKWSVSTQGPHLVVINAGYITEVSHDGSFEIRDYMSGQKVLSEIDTNLLSRSIKHFNKFTKTDN